jgi:hypothetical protein
MEYRLIALILVLATASWAQTSAPAQSATPEKSSDTKCACCDKTAPASTSASAEHKHACLHGKSGQQGTRLLLIRKKCCLQLRRERRHENCAQLLRPPMRSR